MYYVFVRVGEEPADKQSVCFLLPWFGIDSGGTMESFLLIRKRSLLPSGGLFIILPLLLLILSGHTNFAAS